MARGRPISRADAEGRWRCYGCRRRLPLSEYWMLAPGRPQSLCKSCGGAASREAHRRAALRARTTKGRY